MTHLADTIRLYADDPAVGDDLFGRFVREAVELDRMEHPTDYVYLRSEPIPGKPGWRRDVDGKVWYSADWLDLRAMIA